MSDRAQNHATPETHEEAHAGPIKTPKQLLMAAFFCFVGPILIIMGLVTYVSMGNKPSDTAQGGSMALYGVTQADRDRETEARIQKVGTVEIRDANRPLATGEAVFKAQCITCHGAPGIPAAPHFGDAAAWGPRITQGYATLLDHALHGKGMMPPQGGGDFDDLEVGRALVYMANAGGASFPVPDRPAAAAPAAAGDAAAPAATPAAPVAAPAAPVAAATAAPADAPAPAAPAAGK
jgi:cytochrome c5